MAEIEVGRHYYSQYLERIVFVFSVKEGMAAYEYPYITEKGWVAHGNGRIEIEDLLAVEPIKDES